jgi:hypothetical protein
MYMHKEILDSPKYSEYQESETGSVKRRLKES